MRIFENKIPLTFWGLLIIGALQIVWHAPGVIALRNVLMGVFMVVCLFDFKCAERQDWRFLFISKAPFYALVALTFWIVAVNGFLGQHLQKHWSEFATQWIVPSLCFTIGWLYAGLKCDQIKDFEKKIAYILFGSYFIQVFLSDLINIVYSIEFGVFPVKSTPFFDIPYILGSWTTHPILTGRMEFQRPDAFSFVNSIFFTIVAAEIICRILAKRKFIAISNTALILCVFFAFFCAHLLRIRNGNVVLMILSLIVASIWIKNVWVNKSRSARIFLSVTLLFFVGTLSFVSIKTDDRWKDLKETTLYAWDTQSHPEWLTYRGSGELQHQGEKNHKIDASAYLRVSWFKEGLLLVAEKPLGSGYDRNAWGSRLFDKYKQEKRDRSGHSHSGLVDFAIQTGVFGVLLWLVFLGSLITFGLSACRAGSVMPGIFLCLLVVGFFFRSLLDSFMKDQYLQVFMFIAGLLFGMCCAGVGKNRGLCIVRDRRNT